MEVRPGPFRALILAVAPTLETLELVELQSPKPDGQQWAILLFETVVEFDCLSSLRLCDNVDVGIGEWAIASMLTEHLHHCEIATTRCGVVDTAILSALRKCNELETLRCVFELGGGMGRRADEDGAWIAVGDALSWLDNLKALSIADPEPTRQRLFVPCNLDALIDRLPRQIVELDWAIWPRAASHLLRLAARCERLVDLTLLVNPSEGRLVRASVLCVADFLAARGPRLGRRRFRRVQRPASQLYRHPVDDLQRHGRLAADVVFPARRAARHARPARLAQPPHAVAADGRVPRLGQVGRGVQGRRHDLHGPARSDEHRHALRPRRRARQARGDLSRRAAHLRALAQSAERRERRSGRLSSVVIDARLYMYIAFPDYSQEYRSELGSGRIEIIG